MLIPCTAAPALAAMMIFAGAGAVMGQVAPPATAPAAERVMANAHADAELANQILDDHDLSDVAARAAALLKDGFNAGSGYPEVWIRDFATFERIALRVNDPKAVRDSLLMVLRFQRADGDIPDGFTAQKPTGPAADEAQRTRKLATQVVTWREIIVNPAVADHTGFKNSVETDQETSLVAAVGLYVGYTGDRAFLQVEVDGQTVRQRLDAALRFLTRERYSEKHGLIFGATTIDWGDIAPEDDPGAVFNEKTHRAIDVYDNAMLMLAIDAWLPLVADDPAAVQEWTARREAIKANVRRHLWDAKRSKFKPHVYIDASPFPADFDEDAIYYFGGTAVAIQAGILTDAEARDAVAALQRVADAAHARTLGITNWPHYPKGLFANDHVLPGVYQNGGDWDWFGGRMVQALVARGQIAEAYRVLRPMAQRVRRHDGFFEWFDAQDKPQGSGTFRGSAGALGGAIAMLRAWADEHQHDKSAP